MKPCRAKLLGVAAAGVLLSLASAPSLAHGGHHRFHSRVGVFVGIGDPFWPWYGPAYYPPTVIVPSEPPTYIERSDQPGQVQFQYYCDSSQAYYPSVTRCPEPWKQVTAAPSPER